MVDPTKSVSMQFSCM